MTSVLGVDPGSRTTGWGLVACGEREPRLVECGVIRVRAAGSFAERLHRLAAEFETLVRRLAPTEAAVEAPFHGVNARAALQLAHARGVVLAVLAGAGVPVEEYPPATVKKVVTGTGRADKAQVRAMVATLLGAEGISGPSSDRTDAVAVAFCHATTRAFRGAVARARRP